MIGNIAKPTVAMMQTMESCEAKKVRPALRALKPAATASGSSTPSNGASHSSGMVWKLCSHAPAFSATVLRSGLDGPSQTIGLVTS